MKLCAFFGNPWIGLYCKINNEFSLIPKECSEKFERTIETAFNNKIIKTTIGTSSILGIYVAINSNGIVLPNVTSDEEVAQIKAVTKLNVYVAEEKNNAFGNNLLVNDCAGIINPNIEEHERKKIEDALGVEIIRESVAGYPTTGSTATVTNKGLLVHYNTSNEELRKLEEIFKVRGRKGSINMGTGFISLGLIASDSNYIAGEKTSAFELGTVEEALGFI